MTTAVEKPAADRADPEQQAAGTPEQELGELVVCSLEPWDEIWRRNQFFVDALLRRNPALRVLFVEPPADVLFDITQRRRPELPRFRRLAADGRLIAFRPLKALPRRLGPPADALLLWQLRLAVRRIGFERPVLWINDVTYAPLIEQTGWPSLYDVTDDWLLAPSPPRELERLRRLDALALAHADEVVVCSPALAKSRGTDASGHACSERRRCRPLPATAAATAGPARSAHGCLRRVAARRPSRRRAGSRARGRAASIERRLGRARFARLRIAVSAGEPSERVSARRQTLRGRPGIPSARRRDHRPAPRHAVHRLTRSDQGI